jgi:hypothetical protein
MTGNIHNLLNTGTLDDIIEHAAKAKSGSGFSIHMNGKIEQVYP